MASRHPRGPWIHRAAIRLFTLVLAVLIFWLLGFFMQDIRSIRGPDYEQIEARHVDQGLVARSEQLTREIAERSRQIDARSDEQRLAGDQARNIERTINQLIELRRLSIEKDVLLPEEEQAGLTESLNHFLDSQTSYQDLNRQIAGLSAAKRELEDEKRLVEDRIAEQRIPAREEFNGLSERHRLRLAFIQLACLIPVLLVAGGMLIKRKESIYFPLFLALGGATLVKVSLVIHEYFPRRYFKYILILVLLAAVTRILIHFIRTVAFPKSQWLVKQYREAYERFLCPVCEFPIRTGPRRFLFWTRRTVNRGVPPQETVAEEQAYTCPSCGTVLFERCSSCQKIRHALLPHCHHCGAERDGEAGLPAESRGF